MTTEPPTPAPTFASLGLASPLVEVTVDRGYEGPTRVQVEAIPPVLAGRDVWACAPTGSGKTAAYVLPLLDLASRGQGEAPSGTRRPTRVLVVVPTRELAAQVGESFVAYGRRIPAMPRVRTVYGGGSINPQMLALRGGADVLVATPGRLLDLVSKNAVSLDEVKTLVLDEADRLLQHGFREELDTLLELVAGRTQTLLLSATFPPKVQALAKRVLDDPHCVDVSVQYAPAQIEQRAIEVDRPRRTMLLCQLLEDANIDRVLVFVATTHSTEHVAQKLRGKGIRATAMHGRLSQGAREAALAGLKSGKTRVLVATDVAARGVHIEALSMVVNYDLPRAPADYLHRIGRTGRAGAHGVAVSFLTAESRAHFRLIERRHDLMIEREQVPGFEPVEPEVDETHTQGNGGVKGKRKSKKDRLREAAARAASEGETG